MITEIVIGKTYRNINVGRGVIKYTALCLHDNKLFYQWESETLKDCGVLDANDFKYCVEEIPEIPEIPEAPKKFYQITYKRKSGTMTPFIHKYLFTSKKEFLDNITAKEEDLEFFNMTEIVNQVEEL